MAVQKGLGGLRRIRLHEAAVAVGQVQHEVVHLALHSGDDRHRLAEITLGVAGRMGQRHEHLLRPPPTLPDVILDYGVLTVEPVLVLEALKDSHGRVALLPGNSAIAFQDRVNHAGEGLQLGSPWRTLAPVARRHRVGQHLAHRVPVQATGSVVNALFCQQAANSRAGSTPGGPSRTLMPSTMQACRT